MASFRVQSASMRDALKRLAGFRWQPTRCFEPQLLNGTGGRDAGCLRVASRIAVRSSVGHDDSSDCWSLRLCCLEVSASEWEVGKYSLSNTRCAKPNKWGVGNNSIGLVGRSYQPSGVFCDPWAAGLRTGGVQMVVMP